MPWPPACTATRQSSSRASSERVQEATSLRPPPEAHPRRQAQVDLYIGVRSEGLRRHLEACDPCETFGFAGFFAPPIRFGPWWSNEAMDLCSVLLRPATQVAERPVTSTGQATSRELAGRQAAAAAEREIDDTRREVLSRFVLAEAGGIVTARSRSPRLSLPPGGRR